MSNITWKNLIINILLVYDDDLKMFDDLVTTFMIKIWTYPYMDQPDIFEEKTDKYP